MSLFEPLFQALLEANARYVIVGGLAAVLHGGARLTADVALVVDFAPHEVRKVIAVLTGLGFEPRAPVPAAHFADESRRRAWIGEKGMQVFSLHDPANPMRAVDLFVQQPIPFEELWQRSELVPLRTVTVRIASMEDLIRLKEIAGRPQDRDDIELLRQIQRLKREPEA